MLTKLQLFLTIWLAFTYGCLIGYDSIRKGHSYVLLADELILILSTVYWVLYVFPFIIRFFLA